MLSGEGNAGDGWKTTHFFCTFPCRCFARLQRKTSRNFFYGGNVIRVLVYVFFSAAHFLIALMAVRISHFVTAATKFSCCSSNKKMSPVFFISRSRSPPPFFSLSFAGPAVYFLLFLCLSLALYSKFVDMIA